MTGCCALAWQTSGAFGCLAFWLHLWGDAKGGIKKENDLNL
jgi:hypothetical protein